MDKRSILNRYRDIELMLNGTIVTDRINIDELAAKLWKKSGMSLRRRLQDPGSMKISEYIDLCRALNIPLEKAQNGDCVLIAGKGHEDYQEICGVKYPMDERVLIREILAEMSPEDRERLQITE